MKIKFENGVLVVNTEVAPEVLGKKNNAVVKDDKGNDIFYLEHSNTANINESGITCNLVVDGSLACVLVMPEGTTIEEIKAAFGDSLVNAAKYLPEIKAQVEAHKAAVDAIFA